eukprot:CAMPEP_0173277052 /NCGR_PEP_ID=MMETSP1143-20121109/3865_1 /TAXON_ID=483371 /ORGANISM="non described non described, Strain CCMP2298" /LENGTH=288 /DNA_ID=CAMNT_0014214099 /DNA_START=120 /DNA_END=982 /DNA_ORIENTATION=+
MSTKIVSDGLIQQVTLYRPLHPLLRLDVGPFLAAYAVLFALCSSSQTQLLLYALIILPIVFSLHLLLFLLAQWSSHIRCMLGYTLAGDVTKAQIAHVTAAPNAGLDKLCPLAHSAATPKSVSIVGREFGVTQQRLDFQKVSYNYDSDRNSFLRLDYPTSGPLSAFLAWTGHTSTDDVVLALMRWGTNEYDIPIPNFLDLYLDHMVAPFFVFQVLCLFLWSLDDYWYYSVFTLLMLMFFEGMMCKQRQASLTMLRNMRRPPVRILCYRSAWVLVSSDSLVPGDVISLTA